MLPWGFSERFQSYQLIAFWGIIIIIIIHKYCLFLFSLDAIFILLEGFVIDGSWLVGWLVGRLVGWILWHINLYSLFNAKSIFIQVISSISNNSV